MGVMQRQAGFWGCWLSTIRTRSANADIAIMARSVPDAVCLVLVIDQAKADEFRRYWGLLKAEVTPS